MSMVKHEIAVEPRALKGKNNARRSRKTGRIPAVVYSRKSEPEMISLNAGNWAALTQHDVNLVYLVDGAKKTAALIKEVQINYLKNQVVHIDFQAVDLEEVVHATVNLHLIGDAIGAARGGVVEQITHALDISAKPADLPEYIEVDVTKLNVGETLHVKDLALPAGVTALADPELVVVHVVTEAAEPEPEAAPAAEAGEAAAEPERVEKAEKADKADKAK